MTVKIVTDSTADISPEVADELGITVVPVYVQFKDKVYRDGVDITNDGFFQKLTTSLVQPITSEPTPEDFVKVYSECAEEADGIVSIHISAKISDTYSSALQGRRIIKGECQIEVIDSNFTSVGLALVTIAAARLAKAGENLPRVVEETQRAISQIRMLGVLDTMKYLVIGGRISKTTASVARIFNIKPLFTFKNGEIARAGLVRTYPQGMDRLYEFVESIPTVQDLAIAYSTDPEQANQLKVRLGSLFPEEQIHIAQLGAGLGVHTGPGVLILALRGRG